MKYRIMVVEDEKIEREANVLTVRLSNPEVEVVCAAENGPDALRKFRTYQPDIVIMDVDLPGISGLEAIREMQQISPNTQYIILSAYNTFSYAQSALKLGVHEYLLKPCKTQELSNSIASAIEAIDLRQSAAGGERAFREKMDAIRPVLESECIFSIASMRESVPLQKMFDFLDLKARSGFVFAIKPENGQRIVIASVKANMETMGIPCIGDILNGLCIFVALSQREFSAEQIEELMRFLSGLLRQSHIECCVGAGLSGESSDELRRSYEQALNALAHANAGGEAFVTYQEGIGEVKQPSFDLQRAAERIRAQMELKDGENVGREVRECFAQLMLQDESREKQDLIIYRLYVQVLSTLREDLLDEAFGALTLEDIQNCSDLCGAADKVTLQLKRLLEESESAAQPQGAGRAAAGAVEYICDHYAENLNLNQVADHLGVTPFYLSKLVKRHTGRTFTEYLTYYRISKAKQLILRGELSIKEITYAVGFNSQNYFAKIFKKYTGSTPSDFRTQRPEAAE